MSITATDLTLWAITCDTCGRPDTIPAYSEDEVTAQLASEGWRTTPALECMTCQAEEGLTVAQIAGDYGPEPGPPAWDRSGL